MGPSRLEVSSIRRRTCMVLPGDLPGIALARSLFFTTLPRSRRQLKSLYRLMKEEVRARDRLPVQLRERHMAKAHGQASFKMLRYSYLTSLVVSQRPPCSQAPLPSLRRCMSNFNFRAAASDPEGSSTWSCVSTSSGSVVGFIGSNFPRLLSSLFSQSSIAPRFFSA
jgi:hypothetical protein